MYEAENDSLLKIYDIINANTRIKKQERLFLVPFKHLYSNTPYYDIFQLFLV